MFALLTWALMITPAWAHPMPDVMVRSFFSADGSMEIRFEIDPRAFTEDPNEEPYIQNWVLGEMTEAERAELIAKADDYVAKAVEVRLLPKGKVEPEVKWRFTGHDDKPLKEIDDPVMLTGEWKTSIPKDIEGYQVQALEYRELSVYFLNHIRDEAVERYQVLFPGETSYVLDLKALAAEIPVTVKASMPPNNQSAIAGLAILAVVIPIVMFVMIMMMKRQNAES